MERMASLGIVFTVGLAMSAPVTAGVIVDNYNGISWASAFVAHKEGGLGPFILDDVLVDDRQASTSQTFRAETNSLALASSTNGAGDEISSLVSAGHSLEVQRNGEQVSILGAATSSIQGDRPTTFFEANNSLGTYTTANLSFSLTMPYEVILDFSWTSRGSTSTYNAQFFELSGRGASPTSIRYDGPNPVSEEYRGLLSPGDYGLTYMAATDNFNVATLPPVAASTRGGFSIQLTPTAQAVPEPAGLALLALGLFGFLKRRVSVC